jgi:hypothetical protein
MYLQEVEVFVKTGTEMVQGQSVIVTVVASVNVYPLPLWVNEQGPGTYVVREETTVVV